MESRKLGHPGWGWRRPLQGAAPWLPVPGARRVSPRRLVVSLASQGGGSGCPAEKRLELTWGTEHPVSRPGQPPEGSAFQTDLRVREKRLPPSSLMASPVSFKARRARSHCCSSLGEAESTHELSTQDSACPPAQGEAVRMPQPGDIRCQGQGYHMEPSWQSRGCPGESGVSAPGSSRAAGPAQGRTPEVCSEETMGRGHGRAGGGGPSRDVGVVALSPRSQTCTRPSLGAVIISSP